MSSNQKTRSPSGQAHKQKVVRGQNLSHRQVALQPATNVQQKQQPSTSKHQYAEGWFSPSGASGQIVVTSAPKRIFPSQTGSNSFTSTQIINKKLFRDDQATDQSAELQWASTLDNPGIQHRTQGGEGNSNESQPHKHRKMQNIQTGNFGVPTQQAAPTTFNLSPMAAVSSSTVAGSSNPNTFQFDLQQQQHFHQAQMNKLGAQSVTTSGLTSTSHNTQFLASQDRRNVVHESSTPHASLFNQTQQFAEVAQIQLENTGSVQKTDSNAQSVPSSKIKKRLVSKSGVQRKGNLQQVSGNGSLRLVQTRAVDRQTKAEEQVVEVNRNQINNIRRQQKPGYQQPERQPSYSQTGVQHGLRVGLARSAQPPSQQQPFEQMNFTAQFNGVASLEPEPDHNTSTGKKEIDRQHPFKQTQEMRVDKREKSSRKPTTNTSTGPKQRQPASQHPKAVLLKQNDNTRGVKMQRIQAFARTDFNSTMRVPVSTKNASSNKKTFLAVATSNAAESLAAAQNNRFAYQDITGIPTEVTTVTPMHSTAQNAQPKVGLRQNLNQPKIIPSSKPQRKPSIQPESNTTDLQKQLVLLQSNEESLDAAQVVTSQSQTSKHNNNKQQFISISHISNKSTAYDQPQKVKMTPSSHRDLSSSKALKQKTTQNQQQLMQIRLVPEDQQQVLATAENSAFGMFMAAKANAFTSSQTSAVQKLQAEPDYSKKSAAIKPKSQERAVSNSQLNQGAAGTQQFKQNFLLNNVTSVPGQPQRMQSSQQAPGTRLDSGQQQHQHHVIASSTTNKIKKSFNFEVEPTKNGPGNKSTTNQKHTGTIKQVAVTNVQAASNTQKVSRQQKHNSTTVQPATSGSSNQQREKRAQVSNTQKHHLLQSNSLSNSRKVLKMTDQILKGLVVNSTTAANTTKVQPGVPGQLMAKKVKIVAAKATSQSKPPAHAQYFDQVGANSAAPGTSAPPKTFSLQAQMQQQQSSLANQKQLFLATKTTNSKSGQPPSSTTASQNTGNTVININIDNRGGSTSSYSHLLPGHMNVPSITVNTQLQDEQRRTAEQQQQNESKGQMRTPVSGGQGQSNAYKKGAAVTSSGSGNAGSKKQTRVGSKDQVSGDALFSPKGITIAAGSGKALPSSTRARHPKTFVFKQDKQSSSGSRIRDDSSLIKNKYEQHEEGSGSQSNARRRQKQIDSNSKVVPNMNQEETMAILSKLFQKTGQPSFNNIKNTKRKSIEKGSQPSQKTDMPSARNRGQAQPSGGKVADFDDMVIEFESQMAAASRGGKPAKKSKQLPESDMQFKKGQKQDKSTNGSDVQEYDLDEEQRRVQITDSGNHKRLNTFANHPNSTQKGKKDKTVKNHQQELDQLENKMAFGGFNQTQPLTGIGQIMQQAPYQFQQNTSPLSKKLQSGFLNKQQENAEAQLAAQKQTNATAYMSLVSSINNAPRANRQPIIFDEQIAEQEAVMKKEKQLKPQLVTNQFFYENSSQNPDESLNQIVKHRTDPQDVSHNLSIGSSSKTNQESPNGSSKKANKQKAKKKGNAEQEAGQKGPQYTMTHINQASDGSSSQHQKRKAEALSHAEVDISNVKVDSFESTPKKEKEPEVPQIQELEKPIKGSQALKQYAKTGKLTDYEKLELMDYQEVYFLGIKHADDKIKGRPGKKYNDGYDDDNGDYNVVVHDHIGFRFEILDFLGKGSFGQALKCIDHFTGEIVAIKIIRNKKKFQHQAGVELKILQHLQDQDPDDRCNIIQIKAHLMFRQHLIISFELFSINLYEFIKNNNFQGFSLSLIRRFAIQILQALKYLREQNVIHCDLKPENILLKSPEKSGIKIIDFGSSCFSDERIYTYIQSRFYRAPEIVLGIPYTTAIDMWSFGCILTELYTGIPIFPGESEHEQLSLIMQVVGLPPEYLLNQATRKANFFQEDSNQPLYGCEDSTGNLRVPSSRPLTEVIGGQSESFLDFIQQCLEWDPEQRITPFQALLHPWIIEGLPAQVLVHHQRMLGIDVPSSHSTTPQVEEEQTDRREPQELEELEHDDEDQYAGQGHVPEGSLAQMIRTQPVPQQFFQDTQQLGRQFYPPAPSTSTNGADNDYETAAEPVGKSRHQPQAEAQQQSNNESMAHKYQPAHQNYEESDSNSGNAGAKKKSQTSNVADILHKLNSHLSKHAHQSTHHNQHPNPSQIKHLHQKFLQ